jgi:hypothetical protein
VPAASQETDVVRAVESAHRRAPEFAANRAVSKYGAVRLSGWAGTADARGAQSIADVRRLRLTEVRAPVTAISGAALASREVIGVPRDGKVIVPAAYQETDVVRAVESPRRRAPVGATNRAVSKYGAVRLSGWAGAVGARGAAQSTVDVLRSRLPEV